MSSPRTSSPGDALLGHRSHRGILHRAGRGGGRRPVLTFLQRTRTLVSWDEDLDLDLVLLDGVLCPQVG